MNVEREPAVLTTRTREPAVDIGTLIVASPDILQGRPRITGADVTVQRSIDWHKLGLMPEEISDRIGHLNSVQVQAA